MKRRRERIGFHPPPRPHQETVPCRQILLTEENAKGGSRKSFPYFLVLTLVHNPNLNFIRVIRLIRFIRLNFDR